MTRASGQITTWQALVGTIVVTLSVVAMIELMNRLLPQQDPETVRLAQQIGEQSASTALQPSIAGGFRCPRPGAVAGTVSSALLYECPRLFDGEVVTYTGEVVGEILLRDDHAWVQLNDDAYATSLGPLGSHGVAAGANSGVGVRIPRDVAEDIENVGASERLGDTLTITGVFHRADAEDGGGTVIRADEVLAMRPGGRRANLEYPGRRLAALILLPTTMAVAVTVFSEQLATAVVPRLRRRRQPQGAETGTT